MRIIDPKHDQIIKLSTYHILVGSLSRSTWINCTLPGAMANYQVKEINPFKSQRFHSTTMGEWQDNTYWEDFWMHYIYYIYIIYDNTQILHGFCTFLLSDVFIELIAFLMLCIFCILLFPSGIIHQLVIIVFFQKNNKINIIHLSNCFAQEMTNGNESRWKFDLVVNDSLRYRTNDNKFSRFRITKVVDQCGQRQWTLKSCDPKRLGLKLLEQKAPVQR